MDVAEEDRSPEVDPESRRPGTADVVVVPLELRQTSGRRPLASRVRLKPGELLSVIPSGSYIWPQLSVRRSRGRPRTGAIREALARDIGPSDYCLGGTPDWELASQVGL